MVARAASALALLAAAASEPFPEGLPRGVRFDNATDLQLRLAENLELLKQHQLRNGTSNGTSNGCDRGMLNVPICYQACNEWCWATSTAMVIDYYKGQNYCEEYACQVAGREFGQQCCPWSNSCRNRPSDFPSACNSGGSPQQIADAASYFAGGPLMVYPTLDQPTLDYAISTNRPVLVLIAWDGGSGHVMVVGGCGGGRYSLHDPWGWYGNPPPQWMSLTYSQLLRYVAPNGSVGKWAYSVAWNLNQNQEAGHAKALLAANEARARSRSAEIAV